MPHWLYKRLAIRSIDRAVGDSAAASQESPGASSPSPGARKRAPDQQQEQRATTRWRELRIRRSEAGGPIHADPGPVVVGGDGVSSLTHPPSANLPPVPAPDASQARSRAGQPVILFDGVCNLCTAAVRFVIERDPAARFSFASLQSDTARRLLEEAGGFATLPDSIVLLDQAGVHTGSDAALRIAAGLRRPWSLASGLTIVPKALRDRLYDFVARHRYRWFGKRDACLVPTPELQARFLDPVTRA